MAGRSLALAACVAGSAPLLGACEHPDPYAVRTPDPNPVRGMPPRQLTFSPEGDWFPSWLPDGSGIGYSYHPLENAEKDRCLAFIPPDGGRIFRQLCQKGLAEAESSNAVSTHGVSRGGRVALVSESGNPRHPFPDFRSLYLGRFGSDTLRRVLGFPYITPSGRLHFSASHLTWPSESTLIYLATIINYKPSAPEVPPDTEATGVELVKLTLRGDSVIARDILPATLGASSVASGPGDTVYFTMGGDSRVFSLASATGQTGVLYDFGALGIARDAQVSGGRLVAVVGGRVRFGFSPFFGIPTQWDSGGVVAAVTLPSGTPAELAAITVVSTVGSHTYRHLALSPSGRRVVAEVYSLVERKLRFVTDTVVNKQANLWLFDVP
jgi:hypothetical protein